MDDLGVPLMLGNLHLSFSWFIRKIHPHILVLNQSISRSQRLSAKAFCSPSVGTPQWRACGSNYFRTSRSKRTWAVGAGESVWGCRKHITVLAMGHGILPDRYFGVSNFMVFFYVTSENDPKYGFKPWAINMCKTIVYVEATILGILRDIIEQCTRQYVLSVNM